MDEKVIADFIALTQASRGAALRFLDASGGNLEEAAERYFSQGETAAQPAPAVPAAAPARVSRPARGGTIRGLGDLGAEDMDEEDDDETNDYFAGGEKSGQLVRGAPKDPPEGGNVDDIFERARQAGATEGRPADINPNAEGGSFQAFAGRPRTLAGGDAAPEASPAAAATDALDQLEEEQRNVTIAFFRNGIFTVNDGEPRRIDDPANAQFMMAITQGRLPAELDPGNPNIMMNVNLVRRDDDYAPPAQPKFKAFGGSGRKLNADSGEGSASGAGAGGSGSAPVSAAIAGSGKVSWEGADDSKPRTSIQLRLADGSRVVATFNLDQTVGHIRQFIRAARPDMPLNYTLGTAFPQAKLEDDGVTLEAAGLANSVVIQKMV